MNQLGLRAAHRQAVQSSTKDSFDIPLERRDCEGRMRQRAYETWCALETYPNTATSNTPASGGKACITNVVIR